MSDAINKEPRGLIGQLPLTVQEAMTNWFSENASMGQGDLRTTVTLESLQRTETADHWIIDRKRLGRAEVMELMLDLTAMGYSLPAILQLSGMPKNRTVMSWLVDYKPFADMMETAEKMRAIIVSEQAIEIMDRQDDADGKQAYRDKCRADLRMRMAEIFHAKKFGKKQMVDVTHHNDDLSSPEVWSRFRSILVTHRDMIEAQTGVKIEVPTMDAEIVATEAAEDEGLPEISMQGTSRPEDPDWSDELTF